MRITIYDKKERSKIKLARIRVLIKYIRRRDKE